MKKTITTGNNIRQLYGKMIVLVFLAHIIFMCIFVTLHLPGLITYNICSCFFYVGVYFLVQKNHFRSVITLVHVEISIFSVVSTCVLGWSPGFTIYLIALTTLVYFCPFTRKTIPYMFSFAEIITFLLLRVHCNYRQPFIQLEETTIFSFYLFNSICCFVIMLYSAFTFQVSANTIERKLTQNNNILQDMVDHDALTHLWSRPFFLTNFYKVLDSGSNIILVMADIDDFKNINDTYGHDCGDFILSKLSDIIRSMCPEQSGICRWGGEEFIIMFYSYNLDEILPLIDRIRLAISEYPFVYHNHQLHITMTFGVSSSIESKNLQELIKIADNRMYEGKRTGKNKLIISDEKA